MGETKGFLTYQRAQLEQESPLERTSHSREFTQSFNKPVLREQGARCMDCGVPFCQRGCPLGNIIPEFNHLVSEEKYRSALDVLLSTNNFPEFTGRVCPAPCEASCVLSINQDSVAIENIEMSLADMGFVQGWIAPSPPTQRSEFRIAIVGSGPAGLAAAQQLNKHGHLVTVFEKSAHAGGLLRYGIPDFKLEKSTVERRIQLMKEEGIEFKCGVDVGKDLSLDTLRSEFDAVLLACGASNPNDIEIPGRHSKDILLAMDYLTDANLFNSTLNTHNPHIRMFDASGKDVVVIGGGDTGSDCIGTARRQGAKSVTQFEIMPRPPSFPRFPRQHQRHMENPWPEWPYMIRTSSSHDEGCQREFGLESVSFELDSSGRLVALVTRSVERVTDPATGRFQLEPIPESEKKWPCQLALIAIGFSGVGKSELFDRSGITLSSRGNVDANDTDFKTKLEGVFVAGDARRGQSLVVWAIAEGRRAAASVHTFLEGRVVKRLSAASCQETCHD